MTIDDLPDLVWPSRKRRKVSDQRKPVGPVDAGGLVPADSVGGSSGNDAASPAPAHPAPSADTPAAGGPGLFEGQLFDTIDLDIPPIKPHQYEPESEWEE